MNNLEKVVEENKANDIQPFVAIVDADTRVRIAPNIGDYKPLGWKQIEVHFVDNSGFGSPNELALTYTQFLLKVKKGHGYAIISEGQFQVYIAEFVKI